MRGIVAASLPALVAALSLVATQAFANPHVRVENRITFEFDDHLVEGLRFARRFDDYFSSHAMRTHDLDGDGALGPEEIQALRTDSFDPLARFDYYVHVWVGNGPGGAGDTVVTMMLQRLEGVLPLTASVSVSAAGGR